MTKLTGLNCIKALLCGTAKKLSVSESCFMESSEKSANMSKINCMK